MPKLLATISVMGTIAMLWVGGHILMANLGADGSGWFNAPMRGYTMSSMTLPSNWCLGWLAGLEFQYAVFCGDWLAGGLSMHLLFGKKAHVE